MGIIRGLRKKELRQSRGDAANIAPKTPHRLPEATVPPILLPPDAAGIAAYQLSKFPSPKAAEFFIDSSLRGKMPETSDMFWALNWEPKGVAGAEPLVLIRNGENVVYPFSFSDVESAFQFVRREIQRGLQIFPVMIYWAVPARAETDFWGRSTVVPPEAPRRALSAQTSNMDKAQGKADAFFSPTEVPQIHRAEIDDESQRFLQDGDIADAVRQANHIAEHAAPGVPETKSNVVPLPAPAPSSRKSKKRDLAVAADPIDFAAASHRVGKSRATRAAINAWSNFAQAVDEALDVHVARQVVIKLAWNRLSRALGQAIDATRRLDAEKTVGKQQEGEVPVREARQRATRAAATEAAPITVARKAARRRGLGVAWKRGSYAMADSTGFVQHDSMLHRAWAIGTRQLAIAAEAFGKRKAMRKAWLNAAWTLEEACYAHILEQKSRAIRAWRVASIGIGEAASPRMSVLKQQRMIRVRAGLNNFSIAVEEAFEATAYREEMIAESAWEALAFALDNAVMAMMFRNRSITAWSNAVLGLGELVHAFIVRRALIRLWRNAGLAIADAVSAHLFKEQSIAAWQTATVAFKRAIVADAKLRIAVAKLDRKQLAAVDKLVKAATAKAAPGRKSRADDLAEESITQPVVPPLSMSLVMLPNEFQPDASDDDFDDLREAQTAEEHCNALIGDACDGVPPRPVRTPLLPGLWRSGDASRWKPREEPFNGFKSPPGRFHHIERTEKLLP